MKKNRIYSLLLMSAGLLIGACATDGLDQANQLPKTPIVNSSEGALQGQILVKFNPEVSAKLDGEQKTRSLGRGRITRSGVANIDRQLEVIGAYELERVFPVDLSAEDRTRETGLHLWYLVHFDENTDLEQAARDLSQLGEISKIEYNHEIKRAFTRPAVPLQSTTPHAVATRAGVSFNDPQLGKQWHYINTGDQEFLNGSIAGADVNCQQAWQTCTGDPSVIVAVMDEGVAWSHPDLQANMWVNEKEIYKSFEDNDGNGYAGDVFGYNFSRDSGVITWEDIADTGHGTHVAGTIAAVNNNGVGVCGVAGGDGTPDSGVKIMTLQTFSGNYGTNMKNQVRGIKYAADNGAVILQCSWGYISAYANVLNYPSRGPKDDETYKKSFPLMWEAFDYFIHNAGSPNGVIDGGLVIFSAGNEQAPGAAYPAGYEDYICVAAMAGDYSPASYTNYSIGIDITAPGGDADRFGKVDGSILSTLPEHLGSYGYMDGTSMSCPHVSGVAALGLAYATKQHKHYRASEYRDLVVRSVQPIDDKLTGKRLFYFSSGVAVDHPSLVDISYYKGKMGSGASDAGLLLRNIDATGVKLVLPNVYVAEGSSQGVELMRCFDQGESATFQAVSGNTSIATVRVEGSKLIVEGKKAGRTDFRVTSSKGQVQTAFITVREQTNSNGWL